MAWPPLDASLTTRHPRPPPQILAARGQVPSEHYAPFMARLAGTVREQIADCAAAAYKSLSVAAAQKMMMFESAGELASYLQEHRVRRCSPGQL